MTDEIPADIMRAAEEAYGDIAHSDWGWDKDDCLIIARAILAERQRCAKIVEDECRNQTEILWGIDGGEEWEHARLLLPEAILKGEPT